MCVFRSSSSTRQVDYGSLLFSSRSRLSFGQLTFLIPRVFHPRVECVLSHRTDGPFLFGLSRSWRANKDAWVEGQSLVQDEDLGALLALQLAKRLAATSEQLVDLLGMPVLIRFHAELVRSEEPDLTDDELRVIESAATVSSLG